MIETADRNVNGTPGLFEMVASGKVKDVKAALGTVDPYTFKDKAGNTLLHRAVYTRARPAITKVIIDAMEQVEVSNSDGDTPLGLAAANGNEKAVELLLAAGAKTDTQDSHGRTSLMKASDTGHAGIVEKLIKHGANVNATDLHGETALMVAACWGYSRVVRTLARGGASCDFRNKHGWSALMFAKDLGHHEVVKILQKYSNVGANRAS
jgi:uncharacterized protein